MEQHGLTIVYDLGRSISQTTINLVGHQEVRFLIEKNFSGKGVSIGKDGELIFSIEPGKEKETIKKLIALFLDEIIQAFGFQAAQQIILNSYQLLKEKYGQNYPLADLLDLTIPSLLEINLKAKV